MESNQQKQQRCKQVVKKLRELYPDAKCALRFQNPLQLLIATILSAQCTDARVNMVTPGLFQRFQTADQFAGAKQEEVEAIIRSTGFYRNKAKNIIACCKAIVGIHDGKIPTTMEELVTLPGIGRKTANVVLGNAFGKPGLPVDTHVGRLSRRLGFSSSNDPVKIEFEIHALVEEKEWTMLGHRLIQHGREICSSRKPDCQHCKLSDICPKIGVTHPVAKAPARKSAK